MAANGFDGLRLRHWRPERRDDGVLVLHFDRADAPVNAFSQEALIELGDALERIALEPPKALVIASGKASGLFLMGPIMPFGKRIAFDQVLPSSSEMRKAVGSPDRPSAESVQSQLAKIQRPLLNT